MSQPAICCGDHFAVSCAATTAHRAGRVASRQGCGRRARRVQDDLVEEVGQVEDAAVDVDGLHAGAPQAVPDRVRHVERERDEAAEHERTRRQEARESSARERESADPRDQEIGRAHV